MIIEVYVLIGFFLLIMSLLDIKDKKMPSILPTAIILFSAIASYFFYQTLVFGILAFIFALLLYEFNWYGGRADIKAMVIIGFTLISLNQFYVFMTLSVLIGFFYTLIFRGIMKVPAHKNVPFVPAIFLIYLTLCIMRFLI